MHVLVECLSIERRAGPEDANGFGGAAPCLVVLDEECPDQHLEGFDGLIRKVRDAAVIDEGDAAVIEQEVIAGVRVAVEEPVAVEAAEAEPVDDFAEPVAFGLVPRLRRRERPALDVLLDKHRIGGQLVIDAWHLDEGVPFEVVVEALLRRSFAKVVELGTNALLQVAHDRARRRGHERPCCRG